MTLNSGLSNNSLLTSESLTSNKDILSDVDLFESVELSPIEQLMRQITANFDRLSSGLTDEIREACRANLNMLSQLLQLDAAMILGISPNETASGYRINEKIISDDTPDNFAGRFMSSVTLPLYCYQVCRDKTSLFVADGSDDPRWNNSSYLESGMNCYLGQPLYWPDGSFFGVLAMFASETRHFQEEVVKIVEHIHIQIESQLRLFVEQEASHVLLHKLSRVEQALAVSEQKYHDLASKDSLTGAYSKKTFQELAVSELSRAARSEKCFSLVLLDVDHFKQINDQYGHMAGDCVLKNLVVTLKEMLRQTDFVARFSGEEFCLLMPEMNPDSVFQVLDRVRSEIAKVPIDYNGDHIYFTVSFGCALYQPGMFTTVEELLNMADSALAKAKHTGRNRVCIERESDDSDDHSLDIGDL